MTEAQLLEAVREALCVDGEGSLTALEIRAATGFGEKSVAQWIRREVEAGRMQVVRKDQTSIIGSRCKVPAYKLL